MEIKKWKITICLIIIFFSGIFIGSVGTTLYIRNMIKNNVNALIRGDTHAATGLIMQRLERTLSLSNKQKKEIGPLIEEAVIKVRALRSKLRPQFKKVFIKTSVKLKKHLNEKQQKELDKLILQIQIGLSKKKNRPQKLKKLF